MRDILDDDERKVKPVSLLMIITALILGSMIIYNAMWGRGSSLYVAQFGMVSSGGTTRMAVTAPGGEANTIIIKYDANIEEVQRALLASGQYKGMVDGVTGQRTKMAIQLYQQENGLPATGEVTPELINHIRYTQKLKAAAEFTGSIDPAPMSGPQALKGNIFKVQTALAKLGYDLGEPSGQLDDATRAAILQFEMENGLSMEGVVDVPLINALGKISG